MCIRDRDYADALKYFGLFVDVVNEPMFADDDELKTDTLNALYACYATLAANMLKDNQAVFKYGNIGKNHKEEGYRALIDRKSTRLNSSHEIPSRMPSSA